MPILKPMSHKIRWAMSLAVFVIFGAVHFVAEARDTGFETGNEFQSVLLEGNLSVTCHDGAATDFAYFRCTRPTLDPVEYARFVTEQPVDADTVALKVRHADGSTRSKASGFEAAKGASSKRFNLWIATVLQRPLLEPGKNTVEYRLVKAGRTVKTGTFIVNVARGRDRFCPDGRATSHNINDCRSSYAICDEYFYRFNFCQ